MSFFLSPALATASPRRVVIVPFEAGRGSPEEAKRLTRLFAEELGKRGCFDVIFPPGEPAFFLPHTGVKQDGTVDPAALSAARRQLGADAFLMGAITVSRPYDPPILGLKVQLVSATSGTVLWAADATFDASEPQVRSLAEQYAESHQEQCSVYGWKVVLISPDRYARFVFWQVLRTL